MISDSTPDVDRLIAEASQLQDSARWHRESAANCRASAARWLEHADQLDHLAAYFEHQAAQLLAIASAEHTVFKAATTDDEDQP